MRLTLVNQFYLPDVSPTAKLAAAVAEHRASRGDEVTVLASRGAYAVGPTPQADGNPSPAETLRVYRTWIPPVGTANLLRRCLCFAVFTLSAAVRMLMLRRQDVIIALTTPPFIAWVAVLHKLFHPRTRIILWNMDCYPEVAERAGTVKAGGLVSRLLRRLNGLLFRRLDHVVCLESEMKLLLQSHYAPAGGELAASVVPNWESRSLAESVRNCRRQVRDRDNPFVILYAGNMGTGHQFDTVLETARALDGQPFQFLFNGGGSRRESVERTARAWRLGNVEFQPYVPSESLPALLAGVDCGLITLRDSMLGVMSPSKLYTNLAAGLPIVYVGPAGSHVDEIVQRFQCGVSLRHGDVQGLRDFLLALRGNPTLHQEFRNRSLQAYEKACSDVHSLAALDRVIDTVCGQEELGVTGDPAAFAQNRKAA